MTKEYYVRLLSVIFPAQNSRTSSVFLAGNYKYHYSNFLNICSFEISGLSSLSFRKMSGCCDNDCSLDRLRERQRGTLWLVMGINILMFFIIGAAALYGNTTALLADSLDNIGDAFTYGLSLFAVSRGTSVKAKVALFKGGLILLAAFVVVAQIIYRFFVPSVPVFEIMGGFSLLALAANSICLFVLWRHRKEDVNMSSVWECSRNDIAANISVFVAAGAVWLTGSGWPDIVVATGLVLLLIRSAIRVISSAMAELRKAS